MIGVDKTIEQSGRGVLGLKCTAGKVGQGDEREKWGRGVNQSEKYVKILLGNL